MHLTVRLRRNLDEKVRKARSTNSPSGQLVKSIAFLIGSTFLTKTADTLANPKIILTALLQSMGTSSFAISALVPLRESGALTPQIWLAGLVTRYQRLGTLYRVGTVIQGLAAGGMLLSAWQLDGQRAGWAIVACPIWLPPIGMIALFSVVAGIGAWSVSSLTEAQERR